ncbi:MAG: hypothetical protein ACRD8U_03170 [Pyrinomonadaceae bacterium]
MSQTTNIVRVYAEKEAFPAEVGLLTMFSQGAAGGATAAFAFMLVIGLLLANGADFLSGSYKLDLVANRT